MLGFIDQRQAERISSWCRKYPESADGYFKEFSELSKLFCERKISFDEFACRSNVIKDKYRFLEGV